MSKSQSGAESDEANGRRGISGSILGSRHPDKRATRLCKAIENDKLKGMLCTIDAGDELKIHGES